jgi:hypothetical protein
MHLLAMLNKYTPSATRVGGIAVALLPLESALQNAWPGQLLQVQLSGSYSKGTAVVGSTDVDFLLSFSSACGLTLEQIYAMVCAWAQGQGLNPRQQNVSIGTTCQGVSVDLVPARRHHQWGNVHSLYVRKRQTWVQTDIQKHITVIQGSGRRAEIRLTKVWRNLRGLVFPSFVLEMAVLTALVGRRHDSLVSNMHAVLEHLAGPFSQCTYQDPANTNNRVSDDMTSTEKSAVAQAARVSLSASNWRQVIW